MRPRAFCKSLEPDEIVLDEAESHHLLHVLRLKQGDQICLFDGCGTEADAVVKCHSRREVFCVVTERRESVAMIRDRVTVIAAPPKGDRLKWMVEKLTEIGVERLILLQTDRTVVTPGESRIDKLSSSVISACKQSRRNDLMQLSPLQTFSSVLEDIKSERLQGQLWIAHPAIPEMTSAIPEAATVETRLLLIGPEGGFTEDEFRAALNAGARVVSWPYNILRVETAAIAFAVRLLCQSADV